VTVEGDRSVEIGDGEVDVFELHGEPRSVLVEIVVYESLDLQYRPGH
jgi:hypothetical protein